MDETRPDPLLTLRDVLGRVDFGRTALYERVRRGSFPSPVKLSATRNAWLESEVQAWIETRRVDRDAVGTLHGHREPP